MITLYISIAFIKYISVIKSDLALYLKKLWRNPKNNLYKVLIRIYFLSKKRFFTPKFVFESFYPRKYKQT